MTTYISIFRAIVKYQKIYIIVQQYKIVMCPAH